MVKNVLRTAAVGALLVAGVAVSGVTAASAATCPSGYACLYRDANASGPVLQLSFSAIQSEYAVNLENYSCQGCSNGEWNDDMTSYINNTGKVLCWYVNGDNWTGSTVSGGHSMNNNNRMYNVLASENDQASAVAVRDDYDPDHKGYYC